MQELALEKRQKKNGLIKIYRNQIFVMRCYDYYKNYNIIQNNFTN